MNDDRRVINEIRRRVEVTVDYDPGELDNRWMSERPNYKAFSHDGVLSSNPDDYFEADVRIMFLLKEAPAGLYASTSKIDAGMIRGIDATSKSKGNSPNFWKLLGMWTYVIDAVSCGVEPDLSDFYGFHNKGGYPLSNVAYVNLKKGNGRSYSTWSDLKRYAGNDRDFLNEQIEMLDPDVIVCCGTYRVYAELVCDGEIPPGSQNVPVRNIDNGRIVIDWPHPSRRCSPDSDFFEFKERCKKERGWFLEIGRRAIGNHNHVMGNMNAHYGSELHLLRWMGRHREAFDKKVQEATKLEVAKWIDFEFSKGETTYDSEIRGVSFLPDGTREAVEALLPSPDWSQAMCWDAVGIATNGTYILVEAKAHAGELKTGKRDRKSEAAIRDKLQDVAAKIDCDGSNWMGPYYQAANRIFVQHILKEQGINAVQLNVFFCGDRRMFKKCPQTKAEWAPLLEKEKEALGIRPDNVFINEHVIDMFLNVAQL